MAPRRTETHARSRALQALYAWDMRGQQNLERVSERVWDDLAVSADERRLAAVLIHVIAGRRAEIDRNLALLGKTDIAGIGRDCLRQVDR